jgi:hypothetical protein
MPKFNIPVTYTMYGTYVIEADCIEDALDKFIADAEDRPLPPTGDYLDESIRCVAEDVIENNELSAGEEDSVREILEEYYRQKYE